MSKVKIDSSGCCIRKGWIQVRLSMYLEPTDPRYNEHHVYVVDETSRKWLQGYKGAVDAMGNPVDQADYDVWIAGLPHIWRDNPFYTKFIFLDTSTSNTQIVAQARDYLQAFLVHWSEGKDMVEAWYIVESPKLIERTLTSQQLTLMNERLTQIKAMVI